MDDKMKAAFDAWVRETRRDSHAWCEFCKAPPAAPCYSHCGLNRMKHAVEWTINYLRRQQEPVAEMRDNVPYLLDAGYALKEGDKLYTKEPK